ncbi:MAG: hypothetical protein WC769_05885 [Thermodesulfovibrionales bacterium]|jgi:hypothetical protein
MTYIVLDKSWLQASRGVNDLSKIALKHRILITDILMYEISTTSDNANKLSCFNKLLSVHNSLDFLPNTGALIHEEMSPYSFRNTFENKLYPSFLYPSFLVGLSKLADRNVKSGNIFNDLYFNYFENKDVEFLKQIGNCISVFFPELRGLKPGEKRSIVKKIIEEVGRNEELVKAVYERICNLSDNPTGMVSFPIVARLNRQWALFRHVQVYLIAGILFCGKFGDDSLNVQSKKLAHDCVDFEYLISGTLANGIATKDNLIKDIFNICCPDGILYN